MRRSFEAFPALAPLIALFTALDVALMHLGPVLQVWYGHDDITLLDGVWRILQGQIPCRDFHIDCGMLNMLMLAGSAKVTGFSASAFVLCNDVVATLGALWGWALARRRMRPLLAFLAPLAIGLLILGVYNLGDPASNTTYGMCYNRLGYALLTLLCIEQFCTSSGDDRFGGLSSGAILALLPLVKITYFLGGVGLVLIRICWFKVSPLWLRALGSGLVAVAIPLLAWLRFNVAGLYHEIVRLPTTRLESYTHPERLLSGLGCLAWLLLGLCVMWYLLPDFKQKRTLGLAVLLLTMLGFGLALTAFSNKIQDIPMASVAGMILMEYHLRHGMRRALVIGLLFLAVSGGLYYRNVQSLVVAWQAASIGPRIPHLESKALGNLYIVNREGFDEPVGKYVKEVNDGIALLRQHCVATDRVAALNFDNPFPAALGLPSPRGAALVYLYQNNFGADVYWPANE
ncbi:MAG: hypothetical protein ACYCW6_21075, partial [Candidatus Xenobia bacterium]